MERQIDQLVSPIDDLLELSCIINGKISLRKEQINLASAVQEAVDTSRQLIQSSGHELIVTVPPQPVYVEADQTRLAQVFSNLLNNSARYTEPGGHIALTVERQGSDAVVTVRDDGIGIPSELLPRVFDRFVQVDQALDRSQGGLGMCLSLVRGLIELHGGRVEACSDGLGKGSAFIVRLPVLQKVAGCEGNGDGEDATCPSSYRILVVDDNRDSAISLALMLQMMGHETRSVYDGVAAVEAAERFKPDVILLDIGLPGMNGYDACRQIRQQPWGENMALIAFTGWGRQEDKLRSKEAGFDFHMVKPVDPTTLGRVIDGLLLKQM